MKFHIWEVATREIVIWEIALGKIPLGKSPIPKTLLLISFLRQNHDQLSAREWIRGGGINPKVFQVWGRPPIRPISSSEFHQETVFKTVWKCNYQNIKHHVFLTSKCFIIHQTKIFNNPWIIIFVSGNKFFVHKYTIKYTTKIWKVYFLFWLFEKLLKVINTLKFGIHYTYINLFKELCIEL